MFSSFGETSMTPHENGRPKTILLQQLLLSGSEVFQSVSRYLPTLKSVSDFLCWKHFGRPVHCISDDPLFFYTMEFLTDAQSVTVYKRYLPLFLQQGDFFTSLCADDPDELISVPGNTLKPDQTVCTELDLVHLLTSLRYWLVSEPQMSVLQFCISNDTWSCTDIDQFEQCFPYLNLFRSLHGVDATEVMNRIVRFGDVDIIKMMIQHGYELGVFSCESAVQSGNVECLKFVLESGCSVTERAFSLAASAGSLSSLQLLHDCSNDPKRFSDTCRVAASEGHLNCVKFLKEHNYRCNYEAAFAATARGHLHVVQYLSTFPSSHYWFQGCTRVAAQKGFIEILEFFNNHRYPWNEQTCSWCAGSGQLETLKYLHEHGCPWDYTTCLAAVHGNHLECLKYAIENECVYVEDMGEDFSESSSQEMRNYVAQLLLDYSNSE